jgi:hypothetical protein
LHGGCTLQHSGRIFSSVFNDPVIAQICTLQNLPFSWLHRIAQPQNPRIQSVRRPKIEPNCARTVQ